MIDVVVLGDEHNLALLSWGSQPNVAPDREEMQHACTESPLIGYRQIKAGQCGPIR